MKKTILYIAASAIGFGLMLTNCSKKTDPAPAATTSTAGTTTTGTTTSGTTSGSTTTSTTAGTTTGAAVPPTPSKMASGTWKVNSNLFTVQSSSFEIDKSLNIIDFSYLFGGQDNVSISFSGIEGMPAAGIYKLVSGWPKLKDEVGIMATGFTGYFSRNESSSYILVTNDSGVFTVHATDIKVFSPTGGSIIVSGKLQLPSVK